MNNVVRIRWAGVVVTAMALAVGCTITEVSDDPDAGEAGTGGGGSGGGPGGAAGDPDAGPAGQAGGGGAADAGVTEEVVPSRSGELETSATCEELEQKLKADAIKRDGERIDRQIAYIRYDYNYDGGAAGSAGSGGSGDEPSQAAGKDYSETNAQAQGVDEADVVKTDGEFIYFLHGEVFTVLNGWPADQLAFSYAQTIEGKPIEMFVHEGRAVVYSHVDGHAVYNAAGVQPKPRMYPNDYGAYGVDDSIPQEWLLTKATIIELQNNQATVTGELYFEGAYLSARRVDDAVRTIVHGGAHGPELESYPENYGSGGAAEQIGAWEALKASNKAKIEAATYQDWTPYRFVRDQGTMKLEQQTCEDFLVPAAGSTSNGLVQLQTFSWTAPTQVHGVSLSARAEHVYATKDSIYVAATASNEDYYYDYYYVPEDKRPPGGTVVPLNNTYIHKFDVSDPTVRPAYVASGALRGATINQFAMDEWSGHLRVATTESQIRWTYYSEYNETYPEQEQTNHVFVLKQDGTTLTPVGQILDLVKEEQMYAVRFMEDRGYVVTFEELDPLFVLDLKTATAPSVLGEAVIPGFSEYVHPIDANYLLTIGQETEDNGAGPMPIGLLLQIFDVSNPTQPALKHKYAFEGDEYAYSEAEKNHKAFTYNPDLKVVVFPYVAADYSGTDIHSALEVFSVDVDQGFTKLGAPTHDDFFTGTWQWCFDDDTFGAAMRRGLFIEDYLYSISYGGVQVHAIQDLTTPVAEVNLAMPSALGYSCAPPY